MSKDDKFNMPMSGAGITRYFDDFKSKFQIKPLTVVAIIIVVIIVVLLLYTMGNSWLGIASN
jgi:preprotein translocase subunit Sec61beta